MYICSGPGSGTVIYRRSQSVFVMIKFEEGYRLEAIGHRKTLRSLSAKISFWDGFLEIKGPHFATILSSVERVRFAGTQQSKTRVPPARCRTAEAAVLHDFSAAQEFVVTPATAIRGNKFERVRSIVSTV